jgi:hypothetical protein
MKNKLSTLVILVSLLLIIFSISVCAESCDGILGITWGTAWYDADKALQSQGFEFIGKDIDNTSIGNGNEEVRYSGSFAGYECEIKYYAPMSTGVYLWVINFGSPNENKFKNLLEMLTQKYGSSKETNLHDPGWGPNAHVHIWNITDSKHSDKVKIELHDTHTAELGFPVWGISLIYTDISLEALEKSEQQQKAEQNL